jgi:hypothetical protein
MYMVSGTNHAVNFMTLSSDTCISGGWHKKRKEKKMKKLMVLVAALALVAGSAMTAAAADWNFYGHARVSTFVTDVEEQVSGGVDTTNYEQGLQGNARIGAIVKVSDELTGGFEYGSGVNVRKLYGEWNFGAGSLLVGQTYTPLNMIYSSQVYGTDSQMLGQGGVYSGREDMIRLKFGGFEIAVLGPNDSDLNTGFDTETSMPAIEANYNLVMDVVSFNLGAGYQTYELLGTPTGDHDVDTYVVALGAKTTFGPAYIGGNVYMGENVGNMIAVSLDGDNTWGDGVKDFNGYADFNGTEVLDNEALGFLIAAGFKANDMFAFEAGYGYLEVEEMGGALDDNEVQTYYVQSTITLAPGVFITPEIGMFDGKEDGTGNFETLYYGAKWQINF